MSARPEHMAGPPRRHHPETVQHSPLRLTPAGRQYSGIDAPAHLLMRSGGPWPHLGGPPSLPPSDG
ncbi:hypothetical protein AB0442_39455 [Kitasatospora sp. NPDC085895]|uniref:hypothetical protein n=1 Tax=Kitasatospora sp. NPDC085895 TaxID=3155057 RepID=UPI00344EF20B